MRVRTDELSDFVYKEYEPVRLSLRIQVLLHPLAKVLDAESKVFLCTVDPRLGGLGALAREYTIFG